MGGFTTIKLKDKTQRNIDTQNARLELCGVPKKYHFYSERDIIFEYEAFKVGVGVFPENQFPKNDIQSLDDFKRYWSAEALGGVFVPEIGSLNFDCYFGRTSKKAMRNIGKYVANNHHAIEKVGGSFIIFMERGMTELERIIIHNDSDIEV